jgi:hypothetical protein
MLSQELCCSDGLLFLGARCRVRKCSPNSYRHYQNVSVPKKFSLGPKLTKINRTITVSATTTKIIPGITKATETDIATDIVTTTISVGDQLIADVVKLAERQIMAPKCMADKNYSPASITSGCACFANVAVVTSTISSTITKTKRFKTEYFHLT